MSRKMLLAFGTVAVLGITGLPAYGGPLSATNSTYGSFDSTFGARDFTIGVSAAITDVDISIVFAKCDDPNLGPSAQLGDPCDGQGLSFDREIVFRLTHGATTVDLVLQDTFSGQTPGAGVVRIRFDDSGAPLPASVTGGTFNPVGSLSDFNGADAIGLWTLFIQDTVGADPLEFYSACLSINGDTGCVSETVVPEPGSMLLLGSGLAGLVRCARRRQGRTS